MLTDDLSPSAPIRLLISHQPWRLMMSLESLQQTPTGVRALVRSGSSPLAQQANELIQEGESYALQLDTNEHLGDEPLVRAKLVERKPRQEGLELSFHYEEPAEPEPTEDHNDTFLYDTF